MTEQINLDPINKTRDTFTDKELHFDSKVSHKTYTEKEIKSIGKEFEKVFCKYLVDSMYKSVELFNEDAGFEKTIWQSFFNEEIANQVAEANNLGIADAIYRQLASQYVKEEMQVDENIESKLESIEPIAQEV